MSATPIVLLVDDEPRMLSALRRSLRREAFEIETASDADSALRRLEAGPPVALVVSDYKMPGKTGIDLLAEVVGRWPGTARILLSGWTAEIAPGDLARADLAATLAKPWDDAELKAVIQQALAG